MSKPTLYWAVKRETYGHSFTYMRVTSEKGNAVFGSERGTPTHCRREDILARHETERRAKDCLLATAQAKADWEPALREAERVLALVKSVRDAAIRRAAQGEAAA